MTRAFFMFCCRALIVLAMLWCIPARSAEKPLKSGGSVVCVSSFDTSAGDATLEGISAAVSDLLQASLARHQDVTVVDRVHLASVMREHEVTVRGLGEPGTAARLGGLLGADKF